MKAVFKDKIDVFPLLWPEITTEQLIYEYKNIVNISLKTLEGITATIDKLPKDKWELNFRNWEAIMKK